MLAGLLTLIAWAIDAQRVNEYAALTVVAFAVGYLVNLEFPLYLTVLGAVILLSGILVVVQFLKYPKDRPMDYAMPLARTRGPTARLTVAAPDQASPGANRGAWDSEPGSDQEG